MNRVTSALAAIGLFAATLTVAGCGQSDSAPVDDGDAIEGMDNSAMKARQLASLPDRQVMASDLIIREHTPTLNFDWHAPPELARAPALLFRLRGDAESEQTQMEESAREFAQMLVEQKREPVPLYYDERWTVTLDNEGLLVLASEMSRYDGGAHPNSGFGAVYWDKEAGREIELPSLFVNWPEARKILEKRACAKLDKQRVEKRGAPLNGDGPDEFTACPPLTDGALLLRGTSTGQLMSVVVRFAPYVAGPYVEGAYEIRLDATPEIKKLFKAKYIPPTA